jgi:H/ACA ribonucleoprotein complex subunit 4
MIPEGLLVRQKTSPGSHGKAPEERSLPELLSAGVLVVDKPSGPTSHQVAAYVQQILGINRAGHAGTLDPKVTGVLPVATLRATRLLEYLLRSGKEYVGVMHLHSDIPEYEVRKKAEEFIGTITQLPPKRSSVARRNRQRTIYDFRFLEVRGRDILFRADVQAGTYIRKLCSDFGLRLGTGAHMASLRRVRAAHYHEEDAVSLQQLADAYALAQKGDEKALRSIIRPAEDIVSHLPVVVVLDSAVNSLTHGSTLKVPGIAQVAADINSGDDVRLLTQKGELVGVGSALISSAEMLEDSGLAVQPRKIIMPETVYPRME